MIWSQMKIRKCVRFFCLAMLVLSLFGCPYQSDVPLAPGEKAKIDTTLIGEWLFFFEGEEQEAENADNRMSITAFNEHEYVIAGQEDGKIELSRAFVTEVAGHRFLNVQEIKDFGAERGKYSLVEYQADGSDSVILRIVEDTLFNDPVNTSRKLHKFIRKNINKEELFGDRMVLKRAVLEP